MPPYVEETLYNIFFEKVILQLFIIANIPKIIRFIE